MRRTSLSTLAAAAALALAACSDTGNPGGDESTPAAGSATEETASPVPNATLTSPVKPGATATAAATAAPTTRSVDGNPQGDECGASQVAEFVGQEATPAVRARLAAQVGHGRIRWIGPDTVVTMDYSAARLNVDLDKANVVTGGRCG